MIRSALGSLLGVVLLLPTSSLSQPFSPARSAGGGPHHDIVLSGERYRISNEQASLSLIELDGTPTVVSQPLPAAPGNAWIRGFRFKDELLLFYERKQGGAILASFDSQTLTENWHSETPEYSENLFVADDSVYLEFGSCIEKYDLATGKRLWSRQGLEGSGWGTPKLSDSSIVYPTRSIPRTSQMQVVTPGFISLDRLTGEVNEEQSYVLEPLLFEELFWMRDQSRTDYFGFHPLPWTSSTALEVTTGGEVTLWDIGHSKPQGKGRLPLDPGDSITSVHVGCVSDRIFLFYVGSKRVAHLVSLDRESLQLMWQHSIAGQRFAKPGNIGSSTAVLVGDDLVENIDLKTGKALWRSSALPVNLDGNSDLLALDTPMVTFETLVFGEALNSLLRPDDEVLTVVESGRLVLDLVSGRVLEHKPSRLESAVAKENI